MSFRHFVFAGALALSSCSTPEAPASKREGLSAAQAKIAGKVVERLARDPEQAEVLAGEGIKKAQGYLERHPEKKEEYKGQLRDFLQENPDVSRMLQDVLR